MASLSSTSEVFRQVDEDFAAVVSRTKARLAPGRPRPGPRPSDLLRLELQRNLEGLDKVVEELDKKNKTQQEQVLGP